MNILTIIENFIPAAFTVPVPPQSFSLTLGALKFNVVIPAVAIEIHKAQG